MGVKSKSGRMTQLEALEIAYDELSSLIPYEGENEKIFVAAGVIEKMIEARKKVKPIAGYDS